MPDTPKPRATWRILEFFKSTVVGGVFVLGPIVILAVIVGKLVDAIVTGAGPVLAWLPFKTVGGVSIVVLVAIAVVIVLCFLAGLLARTTLMGRLVKSVESLVLSKVPGYSLMKSMGESFVGAEGKGTRQPVLARFEASWMIGFIMDTLPDGRLAVFVPAAPNGMTGQLHIMNADRVEKLDVSVTAALDCIGRLGVDYNRMAPKKTTV